MEIREIIARRLQQEMQRKGLKADGLAQEAHLPRSVIDSYLAGSRELLFSELRPICDALTLRLMRLLSANFIESRLQYRATGPLDRARAGAIENVFLAVADLLPSPRRLNFPSPDDSQDDIAWLLANVNSIVEKLSGQYPTVEALYQAAALPILPINAGADAFDAFLMRAESKAVVCINLNKPTLRIHFSLLHELAHYLFHADVEIPIDVLPSALYDDTISSETKPEYIANKFAQLFLIPFKDAEHMASQWQNLDNLSDYLIQHRTGPQVVTNAICDILRIKQKPWNYTAVKNAVEAVADSYNGDASLRAFLDQEGRKLRTHLVNNQDEFSNDVWESVKDDWGIVDDRGTQSCLRY